MQNVDTIIHGAAEIITCAGPNTGLVGDALNTAQTLRNGAIAIADERIVAIGSTPDVLAKYESGHLIDAAGRLVSPGFVDCHSHLLYAGDRCCEYENKVTGKIVGANLEGGINQTIRETRNAPDAFLVAQAMDDLDDALRYGTTTFEAKTGYGLSEQSERRLLALTEELEHTVDVIPTFLMAHVLPDEFKNDRSAYVDLIISMLPDVAKSTRYCDVACDPVCFTPEECLKIGRRARELGMEIRVHADQTGCGRGAEVAAELGAASADHLDYASDEGLRALAAAGAVGVFFPGVTFHLLEMTPPLHSDGVGEPPKLHMPYAVRRAIDAGVVTALSADFNPGSCPSISMQMMMQLGVRLFRLSYAEAWNMSTLNPAVSLGLAEDRGSLEVGKRADILIWSEPDHRRVINQFGANQVAMVFKSGRKVIVNGQLVGDAVRSSTRMELSGT